MRLEIRARQVITLADAAQLARQLSYVNETEADGEVLGRGMYELAAALDRFARHAERGGWRGPVAELFPIDRTVLP